jgi:hypothetical protein
MLVSLDWRMRRVGRGRECEAKNFRIVESPPFGGQLVFHFWDDFHIMEQSMRSFHGANILAGSPKYA